MGQIGIQGNNQQDLGAAPEFTRLDIINHADADMTPALMIRPGLTADQRGYLHFQSREAITRWQTGKNAAGDWILYDTQNDNHPVRILPGSTFFLNSDGVASVYVNNDIGSGTGGFAVYSGGAAPAQRFRVTGGGNIYVGTLPTFVNNAAAIAGGLSAGYLYRNNADPDLVCIVH